MKMSAAEIPKLITEDGIGFESKLTVDDWVVKVDKYEINPSANTLTIHASI